MWNDPKQVELHDQLMKTLAALKAEVMRLEKLTAEMRGENQWDED